MWYCTVCSGTLEHDRAQSSKPFQQPFTLSFHGSVINSFEPVRPSTKHIPSPESPVGGGEVFGGLEEVVKPVERDPESFLIKETYPKPQPPKLLNPKTLRCGLEVAGQPRSFCRRCRSKIKHRVFSGCRVQGISHKVYGLGTFGV